MEISGQKSDMDKKTESGAAKGGPAIFRVPEIEGVQTDSSCKEEGNNGFESMKPGEETNEAEFKKPGEETNEAEFKKPGEENRKPESKNPEEENRKPESKKPGEENRKPESKNPWEENREPEFMKTGEENNRSESVKPKKRTNEPGAMEPAEETNKSDPDEMSEEAAPIFDFEAELKKLPDSPGTYLMHGENDEIIYVGKAISLRRRVRSYFRESTVKSSKIQKMVSHITRFEYIVTDSEMEALILECNLIKENSPKYNTMLKDDKSYPFIRVTVEEAYPRVMLTRHRVKDKSRYFGPYPSVGAVKETLDILQKVYHIRTCNRSLPKDTGKQRPCLNYQMKLCSGPCQGYITVEDYHSQIDRIVSFLEGNDLSLENTLKQKMAEAAEELEFERAAEYRDMLSSLRAVREKQKITEEGAVERDVIGFARQNEEAVVQVFFIRGGKMIGREHFYLHVPEDEEDSQMLASFLKQYYGGTPFIPKELFLPVPLDRQDEEDILGWLTAIRGRKVSAVYPKRGKKEQFVELAAKNARMILEKDREKIRREEARTLGAVHQIEEALGLYGIHRMEAYDISHISGTLSVGSMVVYEDGKPRKNDYRKFRLREVHDGDDYAAMREVLTRRFSHGLREQGKAQAARRGKNDSAEHIPAETVEVEKEVVSVESKETEKEVISAESKETKKEVTSAESEETEKEVVSAENEGLEKEFISGEDSGLANEPASGKKDEKKFIRFPDLICMDGGRGQVNIALEVLGELGLDIPVCGMVKDDHHRTRGLYYNNVETPIGADSEAFKLITRIQDEAHRFAITFHRSLRGKEQVHSVLDDIKGIGPTRRKALMARFADIEAIRAADVETLAATDTMNEAAAKAVYDFFHKKET